MVLPNRPCQFGLRKQRVGGWVGRDSNVEHLATLETVLQDKELPKMPVTLLLRRPVSECTSGMYQLIMYVFGCRVLD